MSNKFYHQNWNYECRERSKVVIVRKNKWSKTQL